MTARALVFESKVNPVTEIEQGLIFIIACAGNASHLGYSRPNSPIGSAC